jgi:hypothetical protein
VCGLNAGSPEQREQWAIADMASLIERHFA